MPSHTYQQVSCRRIPRLIHMAIFDRKLAEQMTEEVGYPPMHGN